MSAPPPAPDCVKSMGCLCWAHAAGASATLPCDASEPTMETYYLEPRCQSLLVALRQRERNTYCLQRAIGDGTYHRTHRTLCQMADLALIGRARGSYTDAYWRLYKDGVTWLRQNGVSVGAKP